MAALGLEVWLNGTKDELRAGWAALHRLGAITQLGEPHPLETPGRFRVYLRLTVPADAIPARPRASEPEQGPSLPLAG